MENNYYRYLASREWGLIKRKIAERSKGWCERCVTREATQVHHLTYERLYRESLEDLLHVCSGCHEFLSGKSDNDPKQQDLKFMGELVDTFNRSSIKRKELFWYTKNGCIKQIQFGPDSKQLVHARLDETTGDWIAVSDNYFAATKYSDEPPHNVEIFL